ncbi:hypothetical protein N3K66_003657 [Trichothecium roseum]|uniref:Uncharacterized protein n=1 Tax=Trichothecium roseum TaxID=47278 RepID=A0ACC0V5U5_9HYPO|nr:hypothetical protein N3K66_003657 [Trichothecium roseum]
MAVLGKRKARSGGETTTTSSSSISAADAEEIFRRHFEAQFDPLDVPTSRRAADDEDDDDEDDDDDSDGSGGEDAGSSGEDEEWGGLSEDDDDGREDDDSAEEGGEKDSSQRRSGRPGKRRAAATAVEVVDHSSAQAPSQTPMTKKELRAFMSSRPPEHPTPSSSSSTTPAAQAKATTPSSLPEDAPSLLAQDLELRRLISESHLLNPKPASSLTAAAGAGAGAGGKAEPRAFASGRIRQKATDLRIQALGSNTSILKQEKMPMNIRKGMVAAAATREAKRRREAKESGIILEREVRKKTKQRTRRGDIDRPGVGRMRGAELRLSDKDVRGIEGTKDVFGRRGGGKRR